MRGCRFGCRAFAAGVLAGQKQFEPSVYVWAGTRIEGHATEPAYQRKELSLIGLQLPLRPFDFDGQQAAIDQLPDPIRSAGPAEPSEPATHFRHAEILTLRPCDKRVMA